MMEPEEQDNVVGAEDEETEEEEEEAPQGGDVVAGDQYYDDDDDDYNDEDDAVEVPRQRTTTPSRKRRYQIPEDDEFDNDTETMIDSIINGEVDVPIHDDKAFIEVPDKISDLQFVQRNGGNQGWTCLHCMFNNKGSFNATKLKAHLARVRGENVKVCSATNVSTNLLDMYKRQWQQYKDRQVRKHKNVEDAEEESKQRMDDSVSRMIEQGTTHAARKLKYSHQVAAANQPKKPRLSSPSSGGKSASGGKSSSGGRQSYLTGNHPNVYEENLKMDHLITSFIFRGGRPFNTVEDPDLLSILRQARFIGHWTRLQTS
jgi:hypothetical protein